MSVEREVAPEWVVGMQLSSLEGRALKGIERERGEGGRERRGRKREEREEERERRGRKRERGEGGRERRFGPVPVAAQAQMSFPSSANGTVAAWMGVGFS